MMRERMRPLLVVVVTLAMLLVAAPVAAKPGCKDLPPDHLDYCGKPTTTTTTQAPVDDGRAGTVCGTDELPADLAWTEDALGTVTGLTFSLSGKKPGACIDVVTDEDLRWLVTITGAGANYLVLVPRDSIAPGDSCGGWLLRNAGNIYGTHLLGYEGYIPATTINACDRYHLDDGYFGEWVDQSLVGDGPDQVPAERCVETDPELGCRVNGEMDVTHPFALQVGMNGRDGYTTYFEVEFLPLVP